MVPYHPSACSSFRASSLTAVRLFALQLFTSRSASRSSRSRAIETPWWTHSPWSAGSARRWWSATSSIEPLTSSPPHHGRTNHAPTRGHGRVVGAVIVDYAVMTTCRIATVARGWWRTTRLSNVDDSAIMIGTPLRAYCTSA